MAHECPYCGQVCDCNGDVEDCVNNRALDIINCICCDDNYDYDDAGTWPEEDAGWEEDEDDA